MKYSKTLQLCDEYNISIYDAMIASEVDFMFSDGRDRDDFEQLCNLTSNAYLKVDTTTSLSQVVDALRTLIDDGVDINTITHHDIINNIKY